MRSVIVPTHPRRPGTACRPIVPHVPVLAADSVPAAPVLGLMAFGLVIAVVGHAGKSNRVVAIGLFLLFLATALMILGAFAAFQGDEVDPRKPDDPRDPSF
jgi:hypothetical protein